MFELGCKAYTSIHNNLELSKYIISNHNGITTSNNIK